jgi:hypothetical protein
LATVVEENWASRALEKPSAFAVKPIGTMFAAALAAMSALEMVLFGEHNETLRRVIIVFRFQFIGHGTNIGHAFR